MNRLKRKKYKWYLLLKFVNFEIMSNDVLPCTTVCRGSVLSLQLLLNGLVKALHNLFRFL